MPAPATPAEPDRWLSTREAAEYAGTTTNALHKAMAAREVHFEQDTPGENTGRPLGQRNVLRALYRAQEGARNADGSPTFPELFEVDERGHLVVGEDGGYVLRNVKRRELRLPDFHALRHGAAMECDDAEEARDLLRHKNSNVTRAVHRAHFGDRRREALRARMEARMEAAGGVEAGRPPGEPAGDAAQLWEIRGARP